MLLVLVSWLGEPRCPFLKFNLSLNITFPNFPTVREKEKKKKKIFQKQIICLTKEFSWKFKVFCFMWNMIAVSEADAQFFNNKKKKNLVSFCKNRKKQFKLQKSLLTSHHLPLWRATVFNWGQNYQIYSGKECQNLWFLSAIVRRL